MIGLATCRCSLEIFPDEIAPICRNGADGERELVMARWGMPGPPQFGGAPITNIRNVGSPHWRGLARQAEPLHRAGDLILRIRGYEAAQDAEMVRAQPRSAIVRVCGSMDALARRSGPKSPSRGEHELFGFLTTEPNAVSRQSDRRPCPSF